jgi:hypothetical protein
VKYLITLVIFRRTNYNIIGLAYEGRMEILLIFLILIFLLGSVGLFLSNQFGFGEPSPRSKKIRRSGARSDELEVKKTRLVKIIPGSTSCVGARKMIDQMYLTKEAPALPLGQCSEEKCLCKYSFLDDRRSLGHRRETHEYLGGFVRNHETDRRQYSGRRTSDILA